MKIRSGFVSNSSSSSFVVIAKPGVIAKMVDESDRNTNLIAEDILFKYGEPEKITLGGVKYELYQKHICTEDLFCDLDLDIETDEAYDLWTAFVDKLSKTKDVAVSEIQC